MGKLFCMKDSVNFVIVGSGLFGSVCARILTDQGKKVLVLERRPNVGGNIYTYEANGITVHAYGAHIFHTSDDNVWSFVQRYASFQPFVNSPIAIYGKERFHLPFNMNTFHELWGVTTAEEAQKRIAEESAAEHIGIPQNLEEQALKLVGRTIYEKLIKGYSEKQWGRSCKLLPPQIINRIPLRFTYDNNYFTDLYQGIPEGGYSALIRKLLDGIEVRTNADFMAQKDKWEKSDAQIIYTGEIDRYFDYAFGKLEYRSLRFETLCLQINDFQGNAVMNYTASKPLFTRIIEHKHFDLGCLNKTQTIISYEYPCDYGPGHEACYPINDEKNEELMEKYRVAASAKEPKVLFGGRLGTYKYLDMDDTVLAAMELCRMIK